MSATTKWNNLPRVEERRGNPRLKVSSLIYAQLGSDNGGIVLNLGMDGLAFHAAQNFTADKNSAINLRLRGSGLNADITGELAWIAGTQKEVGISFKSLPAHVRQDIAEWIARESQPVSSAGHEQIRQQKIVSVIADKAVPDNSVPENRTVLRSLSAALALSRATSMDQAPAATVDVVSQADPSLDALRAESSAAVPPVSPAAGAFPAGGNPNAAADGIKDREQLAGSSSPVVSESSEKNRVPDNPSIVGRPAAAENGPRHPEARKEIAAPQKPVKIAPVAPPQAPAEIGPNAKVAKDMATVPMVGASISAALRRLCRAMFAQKWIPQSLFSAWKGLNDQQKKLLTHIGSGCIGLSIGLILVLALTMSHGSPARSSESKPSPQSTILPVSPDLRTGDLQDGQDQGLATSSTVPLVSKPQSNQPQASVFSKIVNSIFGNNADGTPKISDYQMGLEVWTSQSTGYYYCSDDPYAKQVQPGRPMLQGDALQAGYRPRLGQFCN